MIWTTGVPFVCGFAVHVFSYLWSNVGRKYEINNSHMLNWTPFWVAYDISHHPSMGHESFICPAYSWDIRYLTVINSIGKIMGRVVFGVIWALWHSMGTLEHIPPWITGTTVSYQACNHTCTPSGSVPPVDSRVSGCLREIRNRPIPPRVFPSPFSLLGRIRR